MKTTYIWFKAVMMILSIFCFISCESDNDMELINPMYKIHEFSCGGNFEIPVLTNDWKIESVKDILFGEEMLDEKGSPLALNGNGTVEAANGWLILIRETEDKFTINLKENFNPLNERKFVVCINSNGIRDYVTVTQRAGTNYELVKSVYSEIEEERKIYTSEEECSKLVLRNNTSEEVWEPTGCVFEDVVRLSIFESEDYGAFSWMPEEGVDIIVPDLIIDGYSYGTFDTYTYKEGVTKTPYIKDIPNGSKILLPSHSVIYLSGEITYCKRVCNYTLTIRNVESNTQFEINGIWTQIVPISSHIISSDKPD